MAQLNTTSNLQGTDTQTLTGSFYPMHSLQTESTEIPGNSKQHFKPSTSSKISGGTTNGSFNVKRLAALIDSKEEINKMNMKGTLSETFNMSSFHSPVHSSLQTKSIRQKISNMKPTIPNYIASREDNNAVKTIGYTRTPIDRIFPGSKSPKRESNDILHKNFAELQLPDHHGQVSPSKENSHNKIKQMNKIYKNQLILNHLRKSRATLNTSNSKIDSYSPNNSQNKKFHHSQSNKALWSSYNGFPISSSISNMAEKSSKIMEPEWIQSIRNSQQMKKAISSNFKHKRNSSVKNIAQSSLIVPYMMSLKNSYQKKFSGSYTNANNSANSSFQSYTKDITNNLQNNLSIEKTCELAGNMITHVISDHHGSGHLESKLESLLVNKSTEPQHMEEINGLFDSFIETVCENTKTTENQKVRSMLRKIKLAYEIFFQNYSHNQNTKLIQAEEYQQRLEKNCEILEIKLDEMDIELKNLQKENEKLFIQSKLPKNSTSPSSSLATINKYNRGDIDDTPPGTQNGDLNFSQIETLKTIITEQQNTINAMKKKETKMIRLLYACKQKGLDIEQIYYEDVKSSGQNYSEREEENIPTVNKTAMAQNHPIQEDKSYIQESGSGESRSLAESDLYEKYSNYDQFETQNQNSSIDPSLKNKLKLDFSQLNQPKHKQTTEYVIYDNVPKLNDISKKPIKPNLQGLSLNLKNIKKDEDEEKLIGFHEEFMSRMDEFSVSWRQAAMKERKIP